MEFESPVREIRIHYRRPFRVTFKSEKTAPTQRRKKTKKSHLFPQSELLIPELYKTWRDIGGELTFVYEQTLLDQMDEHYMKEQLRAFTSLQERRTPLATTWPLVDGDSIRGILVTSLSPMDKGLIKWNLHLNAMLKDAFKSDRQRWTSFINFAKVRSPPLPKEVLAAIEAKAEKAIKLHDKDLDCCKKAEAILLRMNDKVGTRAIFRALPKLLMAAGMNRTLAATETHEIVKAWDPQVNASTPESLRVRTIRG